MADALIGTDPATSDRLTHSSYWQWLKSRRWAPVLGILILAAAPRVWWLFTHTYAIENDGAEYAQIAQNLLHGRGYTGLQPGPELLFPPLYPALMAALSPISGVEHAGRLVSVLFGVALPIPVYLIARRVYGKTTGVVAAAAVALNPLLIAYSTAVLSETTYLTLELTAAYVFLRAYDRRSLWLGVIAGGCWALAAMVRPEATLVLGFFTAAAVVWSLMREPDRRPVILPAVAALVVCCLAVLPYALWTSNKSGHLRWDGKATVTGFINQKIGDGDSYSVATAGLSDTGQPTGVLLRPDAYINGDLGSAPLVKPADTIRFERAGVHEIWSYFGRNMLLGAPIITILALIGLFAGPWSARSTRRQLLLLTLAFANAAILGSIGWFEFRFVLPLLPIVLIFAARGVVRSAEFAWVRLSRSRGTPVFQRKLAIPATATIAIALLALLPFVKQSDGKFPSLGQRGTTIATAKVVGSWLRANGGAGGSVMSTSATLAYYAGSTWYPMGYTTSDSAAVAYLESTGATTLVLTSTATDPYQRQWILNGLPDPRYHLVKTFDVNHATTVVYSRSTGN
jgi:4-amino-4-deoxy-L-arabinose transferase-like glycosyltransferase